ncbi:MAG: tetratricopeptide repeat protein [Thermoplasmata archaeon]|nr:tetratricopeptide repeat protein [Thermoplasmata archaeon]
MSSPAFSELVGRLTEAFGQQLDAVRPIPEGFLLKTTDDFLYAFLEDPAQVSLSAVQGLLREVVDRPSRLVVFSSGRLPLALTAELIRQGATVVDGPRFRELVTGLNLGGYIGEEPRAVPPRTAARQLPSARQLDEVINRARTWLDWGVPALALRFFRQAIELKPEFAPARNGVARSFLALGLVPDAQRLFREVLTTSPDNLEARLGLAAAAGALGKPGEEIAIYEKLIEEDPDRMEVHAHLVAALVEGGHWSEVTPELEVMLRKTPEDARLRFLHGAALGKTGHETAGKLERDRARGLGLEFETERALSQHLGLPEPERPSGTEPARPASASRGSPTPPARRPPSTPARRKARKTRTARVAPTPRRSRRRHRKAK